MASATNNGNKTLFYEDVNGQFVERKSFGSLRNNNTQAMSGTTAVESDPNSAQRVRVYQLQMAMDADPDLYGQRHRCE